MITRLPAGALALALMLLAGCGGSGSDDGARVMMLNEARTTTCPDGSTIPAGQSCPTASRLVTQLPFPYQPTGTYTVDGLPRLALEDTAHMPVYRDGERLLVGVDQGAQYVDTFTISEVGSPGFTIGRVMRDLAAALPVATARGDAEVRYGRLSDGVGEQVASAYLHDARGSFASVPRWERLLEVRLVGASSARERQLLIASVQLVNAALPEGSKLSVGASAEPRHDGIDVEFVDCYGPRHTCGGGTAAATTFLRTSNPGDGERVADAHVYFSRETTSYGRQHEAVTLLAHELLHALGLHSHVSSQFASINVGDRRAPSRQPAWRAEAAVTPVPRGPRGPAGALRPPRPRRRPDDVRAVERHGPARRGQRPARQLRRSIAQRLRRAVGLRPGPGERPRRQPGALRRGHLGRSPPGPHARGTHHSRRGTHRREPGDAGRRRVVH